MSDSTTTPAGATLRAKSLNIPVVAKTRIALASPPSGAAHPTAVANTVAHAHRLSPLIFAANKRKISVRGDAPDLQARYSFTGVIFVYRR
jgi:hypothetical protein